MSVLVDTAVVALETPLIGVECGGLVLVFGASDLSPALMVRASDAEGPTVVVVGDVVVEGIPGTTLVTGSSEDPGVVCGRLVIMVVLSVTGIARKITDIFS